MTRPMPGKLHNPQQALGDYLDEMLHQATLETAAKPVTDRLDQVLLPGAMLGIEAADMPDSDVGSEALADSEDGSGNQCETTPGQAPTEFPMQCLMFRVGSHLLSIPLVQLSSVVDWSEAITRLPESPDWMLGLVKHRDSNLRIADSNRLLNINPDSASVPEHLLVLHGSDWAITCDHLEQVVNLEYDDIQWKQGDAGRLVLGTIRQSLSTLLNPPGISNWLNSRQSVSSR